MESKETIGPNPMKISLKYGLLGGLAILTISLIYMFLMNSYSMPYIFTISLIGLSVLAHNKYKSLNDDFLNFWEGVKISLVISLCLAIFDGVGQFTYTSLNFTEYDNMVSELSLNYEDNLTDSGLNDEQIDKAVEWFEWMLQPLNVFLYVNLLFIGIIGGFIFSLIISAFTKKSYNQFQQFEE